MISQTPSMPHFTIQSTGDFKAKRRGQGWRTSYDRRNFVAWDGEGWTEHTDPLCAAKRGRACLRRSCVHHYCLFGNSEGMSVESDSLSTRECLDLILATGDEYPRAIHIGFAFQYDVNMILRDLTPKHMRILKERTHVTWRGYRIENIPKKWFTVSKNGISVRIQDVFSFFASSFVKALKKWDVGSAAEIAEISSGKDNRDSFKLSDVDNFIRPYWEKELVLLVGLGDKLREVLYSAGITITGWYGPGNVASFLYKKHKTESSMNRELPLEVKEASQYAYAGGRFEGLKAGLHEGIIYSADINSAYPHVLSLLPDLQSGVWVRHSSDDAYWAYQTLRPRIGFYRVHFEFTRDFTLRARQLGFPLPVFHRRMSGQVWYPQRSVNWYHTAEFGLLVDMFEKTDGKAFTRFEVKEAWVYEDDGSSPFAWVRDMYEQRKTWQSEGNPAELALKLGLNSLYGKLAQRIGSKGDKPPTWHQLEWAGAITAGCRAMLYRAVLDNWTSVVGMETDGVYATRPFKELENGTGNALGQWKVEEYTGMLFLQNGVYWLRDKNGDWLPPKSRGIPQSHLAFASALDSLRSGISLRASQQYFVGYGTALHRGLSRGDMPGWRQWRNGPKEFEFGGNGKRLHNPKVCPECREGMGLDEGLHTLSLRQSSPDPREIYSTRHYLPWVESEEPAEEILEVRHSKRWDIIDA